MLTFFFFSLFCVRVCVCMLLFFICFVLQEQQHRYALVEDHFARDWMDETVELQERLVRALFAKKFSAAGMTREPTIGEIQYGLM